MTKDQVALVDEITSASELFKGVNIPYNEVFFISAKKNRYIKEHSENNVILILEGQIEVYTNSVSGNEVYLSTLKAGNCLGISNVFNKSKINTNIKCSTDVKALIIPDNVIYELMRNNFELVSRFLKLYNTKIQFLIARIESLTMQSAKQKLVHYLLKNKGDGDAVNIKSKQKLAKYLSISRASLFREIAILKTSGFIEHNDDVLFIKNEEELKKILL